MKTVDIFEDEQLDDLQNSYYIIQKKEGFKFGTDAVLLADFAKECSRGNVLDLCSGTGIVPILLAAKTSAPRISCLEIQKDMWEMSCRSVEYNGLRERISPVCGDLKNCRSFFEPHSFNCVTCNPPYMKYNSAIKNIPEGKMIARHEYMCDINDVVKAAADMLVYRGSFCMVHRPMRLTDIICAMRENNIEPKCMRFVHSGFGKEPVLVLIRGAYRGGAELKILPPMYIHDENGKYTKELDIIYSGGAK